jgi:hypothetical protein
MRAMRTARVRTFLAGLALLGGTTPAFADDEPAGLDVALSRRRNVVQMSFDVTSTFTEEFRKRLSGGLTSLVLMNVALLDQRGDAIVKRTRRCEMRFDIWDEVVHLRTSDGPRIQRKRFPLIEDALRACGVVEQVPLVDSALMRRSSGYRVMVQVALNPVSPELMEKSREFMSNPRGTSSGRPRAFFGAVARFFRSQTGAKADAFVFRSGPLSRPARASP